MNISQIKNVLLTILAWIGGVITAFLGGWDSAIEVLLIMMAIDILTGLTVAMVFRNSKNSTGGSASSRACFKGLLRKVLILVCVGVAVLIDRMIGTPGVCRTAVILFFVANEGLSILENVGLMGVPLPKILKRSLELLKEKAEPDNQSENNHDADPE